MPITRQVYPQIRYCIVCVKKQFSFFFKKNSPEFSHQLASFWINAKTLNTCTLMYVAITRCHKKHPFLGKVYLLVYTSQYKLSYISHFFSSLERPVLLALSCFTFIHFLKRRVRIQLRYVYIRGELNWLSRKASFKGGLRSSRSSKNRCGRISNCSLRAFNTGLTPKLLYGVGTRTTTGILYSIHRTHCALL